MGIVKLTVNWNTTAHRSLYHVISCLGKDTKELKGMHDNLTHISRIYCLGVCMEAQLCIADCYDCCDG